MRPFFKKCYETVSGLASSTIIAIEKKKHNNTTRFKINMMNVITRSSEVSGHCEQINGTNVFYSFPCDVETALQKRIERNLCIG